MQFHDETRMFCVMFSLSTPLFFLCVVQFSSSLICYSDKFPLDSERCNLQLEWRLLSRMQSDAKIESETMRDLLEVTDLH